MKTPKNLIEFIDLLGTEEQCLVYLEGLRWNLKCPKCDSDKLWNHGKRRVKICSNCRTTLCVTAGTVLNRLRIPVRTVLLLGWFLIASKEGISAEELSKELGIDIKTSWLWCQKFRKIMVLDNREKLSGNIEIDEVFIGGSHEGKRGRGALGKAKVVIAVEINTTIKNKDGLYRGMGRVRAKVIPNCSEKTLTNFIQDNIEKGATIYTDGWLGYKNIYTAGYHHIVEKKGVLDYEIYGVNKDEITPNIHIIASLIKRWLLGTHQEYLSKSSYLQDYLEEYTFRFNRRNSTNRGQIFETLIKQIISHKPLKI